MRTLPLEKCGDGPGGTGVLWAAWPPERLTRRSEPEGLLPARPAGPRRCGQKPVSSLWSRGQVGTGFLGAPIPVLCDEARPSKAFC